MWLFLRIYHQYPTWYGIFKDFFFTSPYPNGPADVSAESHQAFATFDLDNNRFVGAAELGNPWFWPSPGPLGHL